MTNKEILHIVNDVNGRCTVAELWAEYCNHDDAALERINNLIRSGHMQERVRHCKFVFLTNLGRLALSDPKGCDLTVKDDICTELSTVKRRNRRLTLMVWALSAAIFVKFICTLLSLI